MTKQRRHGVIAAQCGAVNCDEFARNPMAGLAQLKNTFCQEGLARPGRAGQ